MTDDQTTLIQRSADAPTPAKGPAGPDAQRTSSGAIPKSLAGATERMGKALDKTTREALDRVITWVEANASAVGRN